MWYKEKDAWNIYLLQYQVTIHRNICLTPLRVFLWAGEDVEIIIVNDGSSDDTSKIAHEYEEKYPTIIKAVDKHKQIAC